MVLAACCALAPADMVPEGRVLGLEPCPVLADADFGDDDDKHENSFRMPRFFLGSLVDPGRPCRPFVGGPVEGSGEFSAAVVTATVLWPRRLVIWDAARKGIIRTHTHM